MTAMATATVITTATRTDRSHEQDPRPPVGVFLVSGDCDPPIEDEVHQGEPQLADVAWSKTHEAPPRTVSFVRDFAG